MKNNGTTVKALQDLMAINEIIINCNDINEKQWQNCKTITGFNEINGKTINCKGFNGD